MINDVPLETCWAFNELWNNKFRYQVASCWLLLLNVHICYRESVIAQTGWGLWFITLELWIHFQNETRLLLRYRPTWMNFSQHSDCHQNGLLLCGLQQSSFHWIDDYVSNNNAFYKDSGWLWMILIASEWLWIIKEDTELCEYVYMTPSHFLAPNALTVSEWAQCLKLEVLTKTGVNLRFLVFSRF